MTTRTDDDVIKIISVKTYSKQPTTTLPPFFFFIQSHRHASFFAIPPINVAPRYSSIITPKETPIPGLFFLLIQSQIPIWALKLMLGAGHSSSRSALCTSLSLLLPL